MAFPSLPNLTGRTGSSFASAPGGRSAFGSVPGPIGVPANQFQQVAGVVPGLPKLTNTVVGNIQSAAEGNLSTGTQNLLQDKAAQYGVTSGMPGLSGLSLQNLMQNIGLTSELLTQQGTKDYLSFLTGVGSTQTDPNLAASIEDRNANNAAAPDPRMAAEYQLGLLDRYLQQYGGGNRPSGGSGVSPGGNYQIPNIGGRINPAFLPGPTSYGQNVVGTTAGVFPVGTPGAVTNPGADYKNYYPDPSFADATFGNYFPGAVADPEYTPMAQ